MKIYYIKSPNIIIKGLGTHSIWVLRDSKLDKFERKTIINLCGYTSLESYIANQLNFLATDGTVVDTSTMIVQAGDLEPQLLALCLASMPQFSHSTIETYEKE